MDIQQSIDTVTVLANGIDPTTGEEFPDDSPYNHPDIIRALFVCLQQVTRVAKPKKTLEQRHADNLARGLPKNAGLPWTRELKESLATDFQTGRTLAELAEIHERSIGSIRSELLRQGLIEEEAH